MMLLQFVFLFILFTIICASAMSTAAGSRGYATEMVSARNEPHELFTNTVKDANPFATILPVDAHSDSTYDEFMEEAIEKDHVIIIPHASPLLRDYHHRHPQMSDGWLMHGNEALYVSTSSTYYTNSNSKIK